MKLTNFPGKNIVHKTVITVFMSVLAEATELIQAKFYSGILPTPHRIVSASESIIRNRLIAIKSY